MTTEYTKAQGADGWVRKQWNRGLDLFLKDLNIDPNLVTSTGIGCGITAGYEVSRGHIVRGLGLFAASGLADGIDGYIARKHQRSSETGAYLDSVGDRAVDLSILSGMEIYAGKRGWSKAEKLATLAKYGSLNVSLLRTLAEKEGLKVKEQAFGSRLPRTLAIAACLSIPDERIWEAGLGYLTGATAITVAQRLMPAENTESRNQDHKKRLGANLRILFQIAAETAATNLITQSSDLQTAATLSRPVARYAGFKAERITGKKPTDKPYDLVAAGILALLGKTTNKQLFHDAAGLVILTSNLIRIARGLQGVRRNQPQ